MASAPDASGISKVVVAVDRSKAGAVIGRGGANIRDLKWRSGTKVWLEQEDVDSPQQCRVIISGTPEACAVAQTLLDQLINSNGAPMGGQSAASGDVPPASSSAVGVQPDLSATVTQQLTISDAAFAMLLDPTMSTTLGQLRASGVAVHFSRFHDGNAAEEVTGRRIVKLCGSAHAVEHVKMILGGVEEHHKAAMAAKAYEKHRKLTAEEVLYRYYRPFYDQAGLAYTPPAPLWQDEVDTEAARYKLWASYYATPGGGLDSQHAASNAIAVAAAAAAAANAGVAAIATAAVPNPTNPASACTTSDSHSTAAPSTELSPTSAAGSITAGVTPGALPAGWEQATDASSGRIYYCNGALKVTQWERPAAT